MVGETFRVCGHAHVSNRRIGLTFWGEGGRRGEGAGGGGGGGAGAGVKERDIGGRVCGGGVIRGVRWGWWVGVKGSGF